MAEFNVILRERRFRSGATDAAVMAVCKQGAFALDAVDRYARSHPFGDRARAVCRSGLGDDTDRQGVSITMKPGESEDGLLQVIFTVAPANGYVGEDIVTRSSDATRSLERTKHGIQRGAGFYAEEKDAALLKQASPLKSSAAATASGASGAGGISLAMFE